jgi:hypothetical protein
MKIRWYKNGQLQPNAFQDNDDEKDWFICIWLIHQDEPKHYLIQKIVDEHKIIFYKDLSWHTFSPVSQLLRRLTDEELQQFIDEDDTLLIFHPDSRPNENWSKVHYSEISHLLKK